MFFRLAEQKETTLLKTLTLFLSAAIAATTTSEPSGEADSAALRHVADGRSNRQRVRPQPLPGTGRGVPFVWAWSLSGWILWVARGERLPTRLLAWPVGSLPQHAVPRKASGRVVVLGHA